MRKLSLLAIACLMLSGCCVPRPARQCGSGACAPPQHHHHQQPMHYREHLAFDEVQHPIAGVNGEWSLLPHSACVPYVNLQPALPE